MSKTAYVFDDSSGWRVILRAIVETAGLAFEAREEPPWIPEDDELDAICKASDLFIIDVRLPDKLEGLEVVKKIRAYELNKGLEKKDIFLVSVLEAFRVGDALKDINEPEENYFHKSRMTQFEGRLVEWIQNKSGEE